MDIFVGLLLFLLFVGLVAGIKGHIVLMALVGAVVAWCGWKYGTVEPSRWSTLTMAAGVLMLCGAIPLRKKK